MRAPWSPTWRPSVTGPLVCDRPFRRICGVPASASRVEVTNGCHLRSCYCCCCPRRLSSHRCRCQQVWPWCQPNLPPSCAPRSARKRVPPHPSFRPPRHVRESPLPRADESNEKTGPTFRQPSPGWMASLITVPRGRHRTPGGAGTEVPGHTGAHEHTKDTDEPHNHPRTKPANTRPHNHAQPRNRGRLKLSTMLSTRQQEPVSRSPPERKA